MAPRSSIGFAAAMAPGAKRSAQECKLSDALQRYWIAGSDAALSLQMTLLLLAYSLAPKVAALDENPFSFARCVQAPHLPLIGEY